MRFRRFLTALGIYFFYVFSGLRAGLVAGRASSGEWRQRQHSEPVAGCEWRVLRQLQRFPRAVTAPGRSEGPGMVPLAAKHPGQWGRHRTQDRRDMKRQQRSAPQHYGY